MRITGRKIAIAAALVLSAAMLVMRIAIIKSPSSDIAGVESNVIYSVIRLLNTGELYFDPARLPFSITQYTPLYYYLCAFFGRLAGVDPTTDVHELYAIGRTLNLLFNLLSAFGVYRISRKILGLPIDHSLFAFLSCFMLMFPHNFAARPDTLQDTLSIWTAYFILKIVASPKPALASLLIPAVLATLALYTKQSGIQLFVCIIVYLAAFRKWKMLLFFSLASVLLLSVSFLSYTYAHPFFTRNVIGGVENGVDFSDFVKYILGRRLFLLQILPFAIICAYICLKNRLVFRGMEVERLLCFFVAGTFLFASITALKKGSTIQYYVTFTSLAVTLILYFLQGNAADQSKALSRFRALPFFLITGMMTAFMAYSYKTSVAQSIGEITEARESAAHQLVDYITGNLQLKKDERVFANLSTDYVMPPRASINNRLSENCIVPQLDILYFSKGKLAIMNYDRFNGCLRDGTVKYIIESTPTNMFKITSEYTSLLNANYRKIREMGYYTIYEFAGPASSRE